MATLNAIADDTDTASTASQEPCGGALKSPAELTEIVSMFASTPGWMERVRLRLERRWYERLYHDLDYDVWVISWLPEQSTGFHDHGESAGAFVVATGCLEEHVPGESARLIGPGKPCAFGPGYAHDVRNSSSAPAISIHAYSPPLSEMNGYELDGSELVRREEVYWTAHSLDGDGPAEQRAREQQKTALSIEQVLSAARARLRRLTPADASDAVKDSGAILVDIRPEGQRMIEGSIAGAFVVERNVLEWRFDPASSARLPVATNHDLQVIVFCSEGYTSSLAAAALQDLGLWRATDMVGGFLAWQAAGLPTASAGKP